MTEKGDTLRTKVCDLFGIEFPIVSAGMGGASFAELAAAVSEAGGLGTIALAGFSPKAAHEEIAAARRLTRKPVAVNLLVPFLRPGVLESLLEEPIEAITFFWGDPADCAARCQARGIKVIWQCGSAEEALAAKRGGADAIIVQGVEAGGHVRGTVTTLALVPEVRDLIGDTPLLAAGGIADGRGLVACLALGADGAVFGTRFLASKESGAHAVYKQKILQARAEDTACVNLFDVGWPDAPHRVLRTAVVEEWERAGRPISGRRPGEGQPVAMLRRSGIEMPIAKYSVMSPSTFIDGDVESMAFYAGQSCGTVNDILPAGEIVRRIADEARDVISRRLAPLAR
jgi:nitronate monooxygenase